MAGYLRKYVGTYRVKAEYDLDTKDFPRDMQGKIDSTFDDLYIDCKYGTRITHGLGSVLGCWIPSKPRGRNMFRQICKDKLGVDEPAGDDTYATKLCALLVKNEILLDAELLDYEARFTFKAEMVEYIADLVGAKTNGASISPFSSKNLPKEKYDIPESDMEKYKAIVSKLPTKTVVNKGVEREMVDGLFINRVTKSFDDVIKKAKPKGFDVVADRKKTTLGNKEYIHSLGLWEKYCEFLNKNLFK